jgi:hypothetical protein
MIVREVATKLMMVSGNWPPRSDKSGHSEKLLEKVYLMAVYLQKYFDNPDVNLNNRLINLYKYNFTLIELLK